jgi:uncharacterized protein YggE
MNSLSLIALFVLCASSADASVERMVAASGTCTKAVVPDRGSLNVTANVQDMDLQKASKKATDAYDKLKSAIQKLNLKDVEISTSEYDLSEVREWEKEKSVFKGFRARMGLSVTTSEIARLGEVISIAANQGLREVGSLRTFLSDKKSEDERANCLESAVDNARAKASRMAKAANVKLGRVLTINESGASFPQPPMPRMEMAMAKGMAMDQASTAVDAGTQRLSVSVDVTFGLE